MGEVRKYGGGCLAVRRGDFESLAVYKFSEGDPDVVYMVGAVCLLQLNMVVEMGRLVMRGRR